MTIRYPSELDTGAEIPQVSDNITEISSETLNAMREAIFAIEKAIGVDPQGSTASLVNRLSNALNDDGTFKASALLAAGLIALPITNSMIGSSAAIAESKLDLDFATQTLRDAISSNDVDIATLQAALASLINSFNQHVAGTAFQHDSYAILLDVLSPSSTPAAFIGMSSTTVGDAIIELNNDLINHEAEGTIAAHRAANITIDALSFSATNVQEALEGLDIAAEDRLIKHRDDQHSNGFSNWANGSDGYNTKLQIVPATLNSSVLSYILPGQRNTIEFTGIDLTSFSAKQADAVLILDGYSQGVYSIDDIGPRNPVGSKPALTSSQIEVVGTFPDDGYVQAMIFGKSSVALFKTIVAPTIHQSDIRVDSLQLCRPDSAKALSLGINPRFIDSTHTLAIEVGTGPGTVRSLTVSNLHFDRTGAPASPVSIASIVERINSVFQNRVDGNAFPAAAYRVGDELLLAHNWTDSSDYTLRVLSTGTGNFELGFDGYGANILDTYIRPTIDASFYVSGQRLSDFANILTDTASAAGQILTLTSNPLEAGVKIGHLVHVKSHPSNQSALGTYFIIGVSSSAITVHKNAGITAGSSIDVEVLHDALPLDDFSGNTRNCVLNAFVDFQGRLGYNQRIDYSANIANLSIVDVSDNFAEGAATLTSTISGSTLSLKLTVNGVDGPITRLPTSVSGQFKLSSASNIESLIVDISTPVSAASNSISVHPQIDEEEVLEICTVRLDGITTLSNIVDKRLFGSIGLDELREDITQAYVETPLVDLRSNGFVNGFEVLTNNYQDTSVFDADVFGVLLQGGIAYVGGVRVDVPTLPVMFPRTAGTFYTALNSLGTYNVISGTDYTLEQILDGYAGTYLPVVQTVHSGGLSNPLTTTDLRFFINDLDSKIELILDITNRRVGNFASVEAALAYINNYPHDEKFRLRVVSFTNDNISIPSGFNEISIEIDGTIGSFTTASDCKVYTNSVSRRTKPHILGSLTVSSGCNNFELSGVEVSGTATINSSTYLSIHKATFLSSLSVSSSVATGSITESKFLGATSISAGITFYNGCEMNGTTFNIAGGNTAEISNCQISTSARSTIDAFSATFSNCVFSWQSSGLFDIANGKVHLIGCLFSNSSQSSGSAIGVDAGEFTVKFQSCLFAGLEFTGTASLLESGDNTNKVSFDGCDFNDISFSSSSEMITCTSFNNNTSTLFSGGALIKLIGASSFCNNNGFATITTDTSSTDRPMLVSGNIFPASSLGYNIDISQSSSTSLAQAIITGNIFLDIQDDGILCGANTARVIISNNYFGEGSSGNAINFGVSPQHIDISDNIFQCQTAFSSSSPVSHASIRGNRFITTTSYSLQVGETFDFSGNHSFGAGTFSLTGTSVKTLTLNNNYFLTALSVQVQTGDAENGFSISDNIFLSLELNANFKNGTISGNKISIFESAGIDITLDGVLVANNKIGLLTNFINMIWTNSEWVGNNIGGDAAFNVANSVRISQNIMEDGYAMSIRSLSLGAINFLDFSNNDMNGSSVHVFEAVNDSMFANNKQIGFAFDGNVNRTIFTGNETTDQSWIFSEDLVESIVQGNYIHSFAIDGPTISFLTLRGNIFTSSMALVARTTFSNVNISGNQGNGIGTNISMQAAGDATNITVCNNTVHGITLNGSGTVSLINISDNQTVANITLLSDGLTYGSLIGNKVVGLFLTFDTGFDVKLIGNTSNAAGTVSFGTTLDTSVFAFNNFIGNWNFSGTTGISNMQFISNTVIGTLTLPATAAFGSTTSQSKFIGNYADTWSSSGLATSGATILFPWGNTGNSTSSVTFTGTTAINATTANKLAGTGITV